VKVVLGILLLVFGAFAYNLYGLLKDIPKASVLTFYTYDYAQFDCPLFGVTSVDVVSESMAQECNITKTDKKLMDYYSSGFYQNTLHIEQKYKYRILGGFCYVHNGAKIYNYQLAKEGYGLFFMPENIKTQEAKKELDIIKMLVLEARRERRGLWKEWRDEMECLQGKIYDIFKDN